MICLQDEDTSQKQVGTKLMSACLECLLSARLTKSHQPFLPEEKIKQHSLSFSSKISLLTF